MADKKQSTLVYSSEFGRICPGCEKPAGSCVCNSKAVYKSDGIVRVGRETKGRKGSGVTIISGIMGDEEAIKKIAADLKKKCGAGGAIKNGVIEIQGDHRDKLILELEKLGYKVKRSGG